MLDITTPKFMEILIKDDGNVVWINTEHGCQFRACQIKILVINDNRTTKQINNHEKVIRQDERNKVYDEHGILHGENARRFHEYLSRDPTDDVRTQYLESSKRAYAIIEREKQEKTEFASTRTIKSKFFGTYPIRSLNGRGEMGIHIPSIFTGEYGIYSEDNGETITLIRMGDRRIKDKTP